jgi:hypothetical protein
VRESRRRDEKVAERKLRRASRRRRRRRKGNEMSTGRLGSEDGGGVGTRKRIKRWNY